jgi:hypothetical protein
MALSQNASFHRAASCCGGQVGRIVAAHLQHQRLAAHRRQLGGELLPLGQLQQPS